MQTKKSASGITLQEQNYNVAGNESKRHFNDTRIKVYDISFRSGAINDLFWKGNLEDEKKNAYY